MSPYNGLRGQRFCNSFTFGCTDDTPVDLAGQDQNRPPGHSTMMDTHAHLDFPDFDSDRSDAVSRASEAGVHTIINIATDFDSCQRVLVLADQFPRMYAVLGMHPHEAATWKGREDTRRLKELARHPKVVAIGEIGLDYFRDRSPRDAQRRAFVDQLAVAQELGLPIVIHNRDAHADIVAVIRHEGVPKAGGVFHCFSGTPDAAAEVIGMGFHISVNGITTYKNATMAAVAEKAPLDRILLETDCPFLAPHPHRGKRNEPSFIPLVAAKLAELRGISPADVSTATDQNAARLFRLLQASSS